MWRSLIAMAIALGVGGCASEPPKCDKISYNRHEIPPGPGLLSGPSGSFTLYERGEVDKTQACHPSAYGRGDGAAPKGPTDAAAPGS